EPDPGAVQMGRLGRGAAADLLSAAGGLGAGGDRVVDGGRGCDGSHRQCPAGTATGGPARHRREDDLTGPTGPLCRGWSGVAVVLRRHPCLRGGVADRWIHAGGCPGLAPPPPSRVAAPGGGGVTRYAVLTGTPQRPRVELEVPAGPAGEILAARLRDTMG